jgi:hypothetical protein
MFSKIYDNVRKYVYPVVLAIGLVLCVLWSIAPVRDPLIARHWIDDRTIFGILGLLVAITIFELQQQEKASKRLAETVALFNPSQSSTILFGGVGEVYTKFNPLVKQMVLHSKQPTSLDVLGLTLYSAWPVALAPQIQNGDIQKCTVNLYLLDPEFVKKNRELFKDEWLTEVESKPAEIAAFVKEHEALLKQNQVTVNVKPYPFFPGIHGFRTSDGNVLISFLHWSSQKTVDNPNQFYEIFMPSDTSARGNAYRALFKNWVDRASRG